MRHGISLVLDELEHRDKKSYEELLTGYAQQLDQIDGGLEMGEELRGVQKLCWLVDPTASFDNGSHLQYGVMAVTDRRVIFAASDIFIAWPYGDIEHISETRMGYGRIPEIALLVQGQPIRFSLAKSDGTDSFIATLQEFVTKKGAAVYLRSV